MALYRVQHNKPDTPSAKVPPIHICVLCSREDKRVTRWTFASDRAIAGQVRNNRVAIISDGHSLAKITIYEEFAGVIEDGTSYIMKGYTLRGQHTAYYINAQRGTHFFRSSDVDVPEELVADAQVMLSPPSKAVPLSSWRDQDGFMTLVGNVVELSAVRPVTCVGSEVPIRNITLQQDKTQVPVILWREAAAINTVTIGCQITITHLLKKESNYGLQLHTTNFSMIEETTHHNKSITVVGIIPEEQGLVKLLLDDSRELMMHTSLWQPYDHLLKYGPVQLTVTIEGTKIISVQSEN